MKPLEHLPPRPRPEEPMPVPPKPAPDKQPPSQEPPQEGDKRPGRDKRLLMEESMNSSYFVRGSASVALAILLAGCATWNDMNRQEKGTAVGATGGAVVGAVVGGPVGALKEMKRPVDPGEAVPTPQGADSEIDPSGRPPRPA